MLLCCKIVEVFRPSVGIMRSIEFSLFLVLAFECGALLVTSQCSKDDVVALMAFKRAIFEDPMSVLADWNGDGVDPCSWNGVSCSHPQNRVISLHLSNASLKGFIAPEVGLLSSLQELILADNLILGTIPAQIGALSSLRVLDLSVNHLSGPIPPEIGNLTSITKIDLHSNGLTGNIPHEFGNILNLVELRLDRNRLNGPLPESNGSNSSLTMYGMGMSESQSGWKGSCHSSRLQVADFSYNFFVGRIPSCLKYLPRSSFQGNCLQDRDAFLQRSAQKCAPSRIQSIGKQDSRGSSALPNHPGSRQPEWLLILELVTGALVVVSLLTATATAVKRCTPKAANITPWKRDTKWKDHIEISFDGEMLTNIKRLSRQELEVSCEDFSNIIGSCPDSVVYKGILKDGREIAVISLCIPQVNWTIYHEFLFQTRVADLARLNHENVANLLGYCEEEEPFTRMVAFDYASNGTLFEHLHYGEGCQFSWLRRMKIAIGIARGLKYLHTELQPPFTLSEFNSNAVYLTEDFSPKIVDFESWKVVYTKSEKNSSHVPRGGAFYSPVGSQEQRHFEMQANTYAFGVMLLEIISGRLPYCKDRGPLVDWAMEHLQQPEKIGNLVDPTLSSVKHEELAVICSVVSLCTEPDPSKRPSMQIITGVLENGIDTSATAVLRDSPWAELALSS